MQKWDYKLLHRVRDVPNFNGPGKYELFEDGKSIGKSVDTLAKLKELGDAGWELVAVSSSSGIPGSTGGFSGITTQEVWVLKQPK